MMNFFMSMVTFSCLDVSNSENKTDLRKIHVEPRRMKTLILDVYWGQKWRDFRYS